MKETSPDQASQWLRREGLRATRGRIAIVEILQNAEVPLTLKDLHQKVRKSGCDFATVFRFIMLLEGKKLVEKVSWIDGSTRHEIRSGDHHHHHHYLICRECQKIEAIDDCVVGTFESQIARERGYVAMDHSLQLSGVCPACQKPAKKSRAAR